MGGGAYIALVGRRRERAWLKARLEALDAFERGRLARERPELDRSVPAAQFSFVEEVA